MQRMQTLLWNHKLCRQSIHSNVETTEDNQDQSHVVTVHEWGKHPAGFPFVQELGQNTLRWLERKRWHNCLIPHEEQPLSLQPQRQDSNTSCRTYKGRLTAKHARTADPQLERGVNLTWMGYFLLDPRRSRTVRQCQSSLSTSVICHRRRWAGGAAAFPTRLFILKSSLHLHFFWS